MRLLLVEVLLFAGLFNEAVGDYLDINECFVEMPNFQLSVDTMGVESVEFKDDCLRACLRSQLRGKPCAGVEHRPKDNSCVLSDKTGERRPTNEQKRGSYYENVCARPPEGGRLEARLTGFRGGEGILELAQRKGQNPKLLAIMTGLQENKNFHLIYMPDIELSSCYKAGIMNSHKGQKLITIDSDSRGMAIQPWTDIDFHILDDGVIDKVYTGPVNHPCITEYRAFALPRRTTNAARQTIRAMWLPKLMFYICFPPFLKQKHIHKEERWKHRQNINTFNPWAVPLSSALPRRVGSAAR
ncbi:hypothetical protein Y032_0041g483 [Ancylostoma ceylanicum]|uniref:Apple domain-containing protein n=1 Tax=Ancylostoma ceylanicum TaxID=53326 RepID=A0A016UI89_9BILA|nr:hypothetical protein Y032_0041g483 [Ancylostoma ceylanicum]